MKPRIRIMAVARPAGMNKLESFVNDFGAANLARRLKVSEGAVSHWKSGRCSISPKRCREIESLSGGRITIHDLRPDIFGPPPGPSTQDQAA